MYAPRKRKLNLRGGGKSCLKEEILAELSGEIDERELGAYIERQRILRHAVKKEAEKGSKKETNPFEKTSEKRLEELAAHRHEIVAHGAACELSRRSLLNFTKFVMPSYSANWHHKKYAEVLDRFARGEISKLMVFMPPQHGKNQLCSRMLPAFTLGQNPDTRVALASYNHDFAVKFNRDVQRIADSDPFRELFPDTLLNSQSIREQKSRLSNLDMRAVRLLERTQREGERQAEGAANVHFNRQRREILSAFEESTKAKKADGTDEGSFDQLKKQLDGVISPIKRAEIVANFVGRLSDWSQDEERVRGLLSNMWERSCTQGQGIMQRLYDLKNPKRPEVLNVFKRMGGGKIAKDISGTTKQKICEIIENGLQNSEAAADIAKKISESADLGSYRAKLIASQETANSISAANFPIWFCNKVRRRNVYGPKLGWTFNPDMETRLKTMKSAAGQYIAIESFRQNDDEWDLLLTDTNSRTYQEVLIASAASAEPALAELRTGRVRAIPSVLKATACTWRTRTNRRF
jgi:hypothetical protein